MSISDLPTETVPPPDSPRAPRRDDPLRRIALAALAVMVPLVAAAIVVPRLIGSDDGPANRSVAQVSGPASSPRADLPVLSVEVPEVTPQAQQSCPAVMGGLPLDLAGKPSRRVRSTSPFAYAWGDPPVVLVCGVPRPAGLEPTSGLIQINGVQWLVDTSRTDRVVWTAVDRPVYLQVTVSADTDSAPVTALSTVLAEALPARAVGTGA